MEQPFDDSPSKRWEQAMLDAQLRMEQSVNIMRNWIVFCCVIGLLTGLFFAIVTLLDLGI